MREGDDIKIGGETYKLVHHAAYRGHPTCQDIRCTRMKPLDEPGCYGWHCAQCDAPTSMMGHDCPTRN